MKKKKRKKDWKRTEQNIQKLWTITKDITYMLGITQRRRKKEMNRTQAVFEAVMTVNFPQD